VVNAADAVIASQKQTTWAASRSSAFSSAGVNALSNHFGQSGAIVAETIPLTGGMSSESLRSAAGGLDPAIADLLFGQPAGRITDLNAPPKMVRSSRCGVARRHVARNEVY
jgi:hypothetical protein